MLALTCTWLPLRVKGCAIAVASRSSSSLRPSAPAACSIRIANSSPPSRATVSAARAQQRNRSAAEISSRSPSAWPRLSFTRLKSSRSRKSTVIGWACRCARASAWLTRSRNSARLARPVSGSWNAWWVSCSSSRFRSLTSRVLSTMPSDRGVAGEVGRQDLGVQPGAVGLAEAPLDRTGDARGPHRVLEERRGPVAVVGVEQGHQRTAHHLGGVVAEHPVGRGAHEAHRPVGAGHDDDVGRVLDQRAEPGLVLPHRGLGQQPDVLPHGEELPRHHQRRHQQRADREAADRIGPGVEHAVQQQRVGGGHREVGQRAHRLVAAAAASRPPPSAAPAGGSTARRWRSASRSRAGTRRR